MKRLVLFISILMVLPSIGFAQTLGNTVATVNLTKMEAITSKEVNKKLNQLKEIGSQSGIPQDQITRENVMESLIDQTLIKQAAERDGVKVPDSRVDRMIEEQRRAYMQNSGRRIDQEQFEQVVQNETGYSWEQYRSQIREQLLQQMYITSRKQAMFENIDPPTEAEIEQQYRENATQFTNPEYVRLSQVFISTQNKSESEIENAREKIQKAYQKFKSGELSFSDVVLKYSEDENSKYRDGDVGYITRDNTQVRSAYGENFFSTIFGLEEGEVSKVIESNVGFHIVKVTEHEPAKLLQLEDKLSPDSQTTLRDYLRRMLYQNKQQEVFRRAMDEVVSDLREEAEIVTYDE